MTLAKPSERIHSSEQIRLVAGTTVVIFARAGDRWEHEVRVADGRVWLSIEGPADQQSDPRWPASPPLVEVSLAATSNGAAILGVGRAGRSHYSLAIAACPGTADTLLFDVACRIHEPPHWLGSSYQLAGAAVPVRLQACLSASLPTTIRWSYTVGPGGIQTRPAAG